MPRAHWHTDPTATAGRKQRAPWLQSSSDERSVPSVTWPTGHSLHPVAPAASWYWVDAQAVQVSSDAAPVALLCFPAAQAVHGGLPLGPKKPALHVQAADPGGLLEPEGHLRRKRRRPERE